MPSRRIPDLFRGAVITIDGPAGSGKSTTARLLAARLGFEYVDTGAMYRAVTLLADRLGTDLDREPDLEAVLKEMEGRFRTAQGDGGMRVYLGGEDVTDQIRTPRIDRLVSAVSAHPAVRAFLVKWQRQRAAAGNVVLEGRDTGTVVCPGGDAKIYLEASLGERARRRIRERGESDDARPLAQEEDNLQRRDRADSGRAHGPLRQAADAIVIDTSTLSIEEQVEAVLRACENRLRAKRGDG